MLLLYMRRGAKGTAGHELRSAQPDQHCSLELPHRDVLDEDRTTLDTGTGESGTRLDRDYDCQSHDPQGKATARRPRDRDGRSWPSRGGAVVRESGIGSALREWLRHMARTSFGISAQPAIVAAAGAAGCNGQSR